LTERGLARLTGISQPHVHNVLKGVRILSLRATDTILRRLDLSVADLLDPEEEAGRSCSTRSRSGSYPEVAVLEGWLGPGLPLPKQASRFERYPFPRPYLASLGNAVMARLAYDPRMTGLFRENDLVLLDQSPGKRRQPDRDSLYVVNRHGEGLVRRLRLERADLLLLKGVRYDQTEHVEVFPLAGMHLLDVVKARVAWVGRSL